MFSLPKNAFITFIANIVIFLTGLVTSIVLARVLGPEGRGIYAEMMLIVSVLGLIGTLGIEISNVYFSANRRYKLQDIISNSLITSLSLGLTVIALFFLVYNLPGFNTIFRKNDIPTSFIWLIILSLPFVLLNNKFINVLLGREMVIAVNAIKIFRNILQMGLTAVLLIVFTQGLLGAVAAYAMTTAGVTALLIFIIKNLGKIQLRVNIHLLKQSIIFGIKGYFGNLVQFLNYRLDMLLVVYFLDAAAVGYYAVAVGIAEKLWMIPGSIGTVLFPRISSIGIEKANHITASISRHTLFTLVPIGFAIFGFAGPIIQFLFGTEFVLSVRPLMILLPGILTLGLCKIYTSDLAGRGKTEFGTLAATVSLFVNLPLNLFLIPRWGISGAAFASSVAYCVTAMLIFICFIKHTKISWRDATLMNKKDFSELLYFVQRHKTKNI